MTTPSDTLSEFIGAAVWHGGLERAREILAAHPEIAGSGIHAAAVVGDDAAVGRLLALDKGNATAKAGPHACEPLVLLCLSRYLRLEPARSEGFLRAARMLLDAGADANSGFWSKGAHPEYETPLYGAAGVAHHAGLTRLLVERGADVNDGEAVYHSPEEDDLGALKVLVETGRLTPDSLVIMLIRKHDWHDEEGVEYLLEHGADPNRNSGWGQTGLQHAIKRDNSARILQLLLEHGADPALEHDGRSGVAMAARRGRGDLLAMFEQRGLPIGLDGVDRLIAACARGNAAAVRAVAEKEPELIRELVAGGGTLLAEFAGTGNGAGVGLLLDLGVGVEALYGGDGYFGIPGGSTALHVAAWRAEHGAVRVLIERGGAVDAADGEGRTPLALAVKACVDSYWAYRRSPESVAALLRAGADARRAPFPCGYAEVDALLAAARG